MRVAIHRPLVAMPSRWERIVPPVAAAFLALQAARLAWAFLAWPESVGIDYHLYLAAAQRWLASGSLYLPLQLAGPYAINQVVATDPLYPPLILWLLVPFTYLPAVLWWAIPMSLTGWSLARLRPSPSAWLVISLLFLPAASWQSFLWGGPSIWILAFAALGAAYGWPAVFVLLKPTLAPFALFGIRRRSWWIALAVFGLMCVPFGSLWVDWIRATIVNPTNSGGLAYSLPYLPVMLVPFVAWWGRHRTAPPVMASGAVL
jgi:hypothetical protein